MATKNTNATKTNKSTKAAKPATVKSDKLGKTQASILKALVKIGRAATRPTIAAMVEKQGGSISRGRVSDEAGNYGALADKKYVKQDLVSVEGEGASLEYTLTAAGRKALDEYVAAKKAAK